MAKKFFNKILDAIGIEEADEEEYDYDDFETDEIDMADEYEDEDEDVLMYDNSNHKKNRKNSKVVDMPTAPSNGMRMVVYQPTSYDDTQNIIDFLKARKPVVVNLEILEIDVAQRVLDFISGAIYSLNGSIHKVSKGIFILAPFGVDISGNIGDSMNSSFYNLGRQSR